MARTVWYSSWERSRYHYNVHCIRMRRIYIENLHQEVVHTAEVGTNIALDLADGHTRLGCYICGKS